MSAQWIDQDLWDAAAWGPLTWTDHNTAEAARSQALYGEVFMCGRCYGVLDHETKQHACQAAKP